MGTARPPCDEAVILTGSCAQPATANGSWILAAAILGSSMAFIDGTVVNIALPRPGCGKGSACDAGGPAMGSGIVCALPCSAATDRRIVGRPVRGLPWKIFTAGVVIFSAASACCGFALDIGQLIFARAMQGGATLLVPGSLALISANTVERERW